MLTLAKNLSHFELKNTNMELVRQHDLLCQALGKMPQLRSIQLPILKASQYSHDLVLSRLTSLGLCGDLNITSNWVHNRWKPVLPNLKHLSLHHTPNWMLGNWGSFLSTSGANLDSLEIMVPNCPRGWKNQWSDHCKIDFPEKWCQNISILRSNQNIQNVSRFTNLQILKTPKLLCDITPLLKLRKLSLLYHDQKTQTPLPPWLEILHLGKMSYSHLPQDLQELKIRLDWYDWGLMKIEKMQGLKKLIVNIPEDKYGRTPTTKTIFLNPNLHTFKLRLGEYGEVLLQPSVHLSKLRALHLSNCATVKTIEGISHLQISPI